MNAKEVCKAIKTKEKERFDKRIKIIIQQIINNNGKVLYRVDYYNYNHKHLPPTEKQCEHLVKLGYKVVHTVVKEFVDQVLVETTPDVYYFNCRYLGIKTHATFKREAQYRDVKAIEVSVCCAKKKE